MVRQPIHKANKFFCSHCITFLNDHQKPLQLQLEFTQTNPHCLVSKQLCPETMQCCAFLHICRSSLWWLQWDQRSTSCCAMHLIFAELGCVDHLGWERSGCARDHCSAYEGIVDPLASTLLFFDALFKSSTPKLDADIHSWHLWKLLCFPL